MQLNWIDIGLLVISAGALIISLINTRHNIKFKKNQDKLNEIKLQKEVKADRPEIVIEIIPNKESNFPEYFALVTNSGGSDALNIEIEYININGWYIDTSNLPYEILKPGKCFRLLAEAPRGGLTPNALCKVKWLDKSDNEYEESAVLSK